MAIDEVRRTPQPLTENEIWGTAAQREPEQAMKTNAGSIHVNLRTQYDNAVLIKMTTLTYEGWLEALLDTANSEIRSLDQERKRLGSALHEEASRETPVELDDDEAADMLDVCAELLTNALAPGPSLPTEARVPEDLDAAKDDVISKARCIRHWHDTGRNGEGMIVSSEAVRSLWESLERLDRAARASIRDGKESK